MNLRDVCPYVGKPNISTLSNDDMRVIAAKFFYKIKGFVFVLGMHYLSLFLNELLKYSYTCISDEVECYIKFFFFKKMIFNT